MNVDKKFIVPAFMAGTLMYGVGKITDKASHGVFDGVENEFEVEIPDWIENVTSFGLAATSIAFLMFIAVEKALQERLKAE